MDDDDVEDLWPGRLVSPRELEEMEADRLAHERPNEPHGLDYCENSKHFTHSFRDRNRAGERICTFCRRRFDDVFKVT